MKKKYTLSPKLLVLAMAFMLFAGLLLGKALIGKRSVTETLRSIPDHSIVEWQLEEQLLLVEVVNQPESIQWGLSGRESLETDGMLFVLPQPSQPVFWMKDMLMPIDIIWIHEGRVVGVEEDIQPAPLGTPDSQLDRFLAPQLVDMVLETPAGKISWE